MGTGVMIGAGIFALTGQIAELAGTWFPLAFLVAAIIAGFSAYSYVKMAQKFPLPGNCHVPQEILRARSHDRRLRFIDVFFNGDQREPRCQNLRNLPPPGV